MSTKTCKKTCQTYETYCGSTECGSSSTEISAPSEISDGGKKLWFLLILVLGQTLKCNLQFAPQNWTWTYQSPGEVRAGLLRKSHKIRVFIT